MKFPDNCSASQPKADGLRRSALARRRKAGFTLVELMVASVVLILGIASAVASIQVGMRTLDSARSTTIASQIIQSEMERIRLLNWTQISDMDLNVEDDVDIAELFPNNEISKEIDDRFDAVRTVTLTPDRGGTMRTITVTVRWTGTEGGTHVRSSSTRYTNNGLYDYYYTRALR